MTYTWECRPFLRGGRERAPERRRRGARVSDGRGGARASSVPVVDELPHAQVLVEGHGGKSLCQSSSRTQSPLRHPPQRLLPLRRPADALCSIHDMGSSISSNLSCNTRAPHDATPPLFLPHTMQGQVRPLTVSKTSQDVAKPTC